jgi:hypothetical protein
LEGLVAMTNQDKLQSESEEKGSQQVRLKRLYEFLLSRTDLGLDFNSSARKANKAVAFNETLIAHQWGMDNYRLFIRRMLRSMYPNKYGKDELELIPTMDLDRLVSVLESLDKYCSRHRDKKYQAGDRWSGVQQRFTQSDKLTALRLYGELSASERNSLSLPMSSSDKILSQLIDRLSDPSLEITEDLLREIYKLTLHKSLSTNSPSFPRALEEREKKVKELVREEVVKILKSRLYSNSQDDLDEKINDYVEKVVRELDRIRFQSGSQQVCEFLEPKISEECRDYLSPNLIIRLTHSVVNNELLTDKFPIFIKYIDVVRVRPLPLWIHDEKNSDGLLDSNLVYDEDKNSNNKIDIAALEQQFAYRVRVSFQIPSRKKSESNKSDETINSEPEINFYQDSTGVGSPISLIMSAINRVLLWDLPCLKKRDIYPVAKQLFLNQDITDNGVNTPVWSHSIVQLCTKKTIEKSLEETSHDNLSEKSQKERKHDYNSWDILGGSATGDFCGFDLLESVAKSGFNARINAIDKLGIDPELYLKEIIYKVNEVKALRQSKKLLKSYPFSLLAMRGLLEDKLFLISNDPNSNEWRYRRRIKSEEETSCEFEEKVPGAEWSLVAYDAHLNITEALLTEGKYAIAKCYLDAIQHHQIHLSEAVRAKYHYLMAQHHYLYDLERPDNAPENYIPIHADRYLAIQKVRSELHEARLCLERKVKVCTVIDELSQNNVHPFFSLLGKIHFLEARIHLSFSAYLGISSSRSKKISLVLINLQQARVYAARDGDFDDYSCYTSFQSWIYSMIAYLDRKDFQKELSHLSKEKCLDWSKMLLRHAFICYKQTGQNSYNSLKHHAGIHHEETETGKPFERFGLTEIESIPFIEENQKIIPQKPSKKLIPEPGLDPILKIHCFSTLKMNEKDLNEFNIPYENEEDIPIYLFGTQSCVLLFASGMNKLATIKRGKDSWVNIDESLKCLIAAWAVAKDGGHANMSNQEKVTNNNMVERYIEIAPFDRFGISVIKALYPHRISYVALLSSVSIVLGEILHIIYSYLKKFNHEPYSWQDHLENSRADLTAMKMHLLDRIYEEDEASQSGTVQKNIQPRFHGHMDTHLIQIYQYLNIIITSIEAGTWNQDRFNSEDLNEIEEVCDDLRDNLMNDLLCLILGESVM